MFFQSALSDFLLIRIASCIVCHRPCIVSRPPFPNPNAITSGLYSLHWSPGGLELDPKCLCWNCDRAGWGNMGTADQQPIPWSISITLGNEQRAHISAFQGKNSQQHKLSTFMINKSAAPVLAVLGLLDGEHPQKRNKEKRIRSKWAVFIFDVHARPRS